MAKGVGFKESVTAFRAIAKDIKSGRLAPAYLLMGEEGYFIARLGDMLADGSLAEEEKAFNRIVAYGKDSDVENLMGCGRMMQMMGGRQVVLVREAQQLKKIEQL